MINYVGVVDLIEEKDIKTLQEWFDRRYKLQLECDKEMKDVGAEHHQIDLRLTVIEQQQRLNNWMTGLIAGGIIALVIKVFLGG